MRPLVVAAGAWPAAPPRRVVAATFARSSTTATTPGSGRARTTAASFVGAPEATRSRATTPGRGALRVPERPHPPGQRPRTRPPVPLGRSRARDQRRRRRRRVRVGRRRRRVRRASRPRRGGMRGDRPRARHSRRRRTPRRRRRLVPRPRRRGQARASAHARRPRRPRRPAGHPARPRRRSGRWRRRTLREVVAEARTRTRNRNRTPIVAFDRHRNRNRPSHTLHRRSFAGRSPSPRRPRRRRARAFRAVLAETFSSDVAATPRRRVPSPSPPRSDGTDHARTRPRSISLRSTILRSTRIVATESTVRIPPGFERERPALGAAVVRAYAFQFRRRGNRRRRRKGMGSRRRRDGRVVHPRAARGTAFDRTRASRFSPRRRSDANATRKSPARVRRLRPTATARPAVAAVDLGGGGSFLTRVASAAEIFFGSRDDLVATEKEAAAFYEATSRVESSRIESTAREDVVAAGLADGRVALFRVRDDGGAKNATLTAILDVSRGWRHLDDIAARAGSNPVPATTATLFTVADDSAATFASSSSSLESIASLVSGDDAGNLRVERVPLGAGFPSHVVPRAHVGEVTCISDAGGGTFLTGARRRRDDGLGRDGGAIEPPLSRRDASTSRLGDSRRRAASTCTATGAAARAARGGACRRWRRRRGSRVHSATTPAKANRRFRPSRAAVRGALSRRAGSRRASRVLWDPAAGALSCVFARIPRIQRGTILKIPRNTTPPRTRTRALPTRRRSPATSTSSQRGGGDDDGRPGSRGGGRGGVRVSPTRARRPDDGRLTARRRRGRRTFAGAAGVRRAAAPRGRRALDPTGRAVPVGQRARVAADASGSAPRALANARLAATTRAWREDETSDEGDDDDAVAVAALFGESPGVHAPRRMTRAKIGAGGAVTIRLPGSGRTDSNADVERALASLALATRASELADTLAAKENAVAGSNLEPVGERATKPSETGCAPATNLATVLANHRRRTTSSVATAAFAAAADAAAVTRHRNSPCDAIRRGLANSCARLAAVPPDSPRRRLRPRLSSNPRRCGLRTAPCRSSSPPPRGLPTRGVHRDSATSSRQRSSRSSRARAHVATLVAPPRV